MYSTVSVEADELGRGSQDACSKGMHYLFLRFSDSLGDGFVNVNSFPWNKSDKKTSPGLYFG